MNTDTYNELQLKINEAFSYRDVPRETLHKKRKPKATKIFTIRLIDKDGERMAVCKREIY